MIAIDVRRRLFAEEIEAVSRLRSPALVDALAAVPRERFLPPGPWTVAADGPEGYMLGAGIRTRPTADADPARIYHNIAVAIDPSRQLFNGQPGTLAAFIDALEPGRGARVLHVGAGLGYYTAILAECVGASGRVLAYEADAELAAGARRNLGSMSQVEMRHGDASTIDDGPFDAILINSGVTHPLDAWLDALAPGGRMLLPLTTSLGATASTIGKGLVVVVTNDSSRFTARVMTIVAIYTAVGVRDEAMNDRVGKALAAGPARWQTVSELRRHSHQPDSTCWLHGDRFCLASSAR